MNAPRRFANAVIVHANFVQFGPGLRVQFPRVESRMVLWCEAGTGEVTANGAVCPLEAGRYLLLPWGHAISYRASRDDPFFLAGVHVVPNHRPDRRVTFDVAHDEQHPLAWAPFRRDLAIPELAGVKMGGFDGQAPITHLLEYIVRLFIRGTPPEWLARQLAQELLYELMLFEQRREVHDHSAPPELERLKQFILSNVHRPLSLRDLVEFSKLSSSTVGRIFREHLHTTPVTWIRRVKMERAGTLLRTRRLSVAEVGAQVGIPDPYYFSKCFKKLTGQSPRQHRRQTRWL